LKVLYIATNFTALTHTFITREVAELQGLGLGVELLSLRTHTGEAGVSAPECDLAGCRFAYPMPVRRLVPGVLLRALRHPLRFIRAARAATASRLDPPRTKLKLLYQLGVAAALAPEIERAGCGHIHAHFATSPTTFAMFLGLLTDTPFSFTGHAADIYRDPVALDTKLRLAAAVRAISAHNLQHYRTLVPVLPRAAVIHCGVDVQHLPYRMRSRAGVPLHIVAVGRLVPKKGFSGLIEALSLLQRRGVAWRADLIGEGPLLGLLKRQAADAGLHNLTFTGPLQQGAVRELLGRADACVLPCVVAPDGDVDGIPVSLMEAMASGCPVISTRVSGLPELIEPDVSGLLAPPGDAAALADALERLTAEPDLAPRLSRGGRAKVERDFNLAHVGEQLRDFFAAVPQNDGKA
jgi:colanic acid/amylovoran biosynthesis glycosyltransferase